MRQKGSATVKAAFQVERENARPVGGTSLRRVLENEPRIRIGPANAKTRYRRGPPMSCLCLRFQASLQDHSD